MSSPVPCSSLELSTEVHQVNMAPLNMQSFACQFFSPTLTQLDLHRFPGTSLVETDACCILEKVNRHLFSPICSFRPWPSSPSWSWERLWKEWCRETVQAPGPWGLFAWRFGCKQRWLDLRVHTTWPEMWQVPQRPKCHRKSACYLGWEFCVSTFCIMYVRN